MLQPTALLQFFWLTNMRSTLLDGKIIH